MKKIALAFASLSVLALSACGIPQSPECVQYQECAAHYDEVTEAATPTDTSAFDADGTCWTNAESATACTESCAATTESLATSLEALDPPAELGPCAPAAAE